MEDMEDILIGRNYTEPKLITTYLSLLKYTESRKHTTIRTNVTI